MSKQREREDREGAVGRAYVIESHTQRTLGFDLGFVVTEQGVVGYYSEPGLLTMWFVKNGRERRRNVKPTLSKRALVTEAKRWLSDLEEES